MSEKDKKVYKYLKYVEQLFILASKITGCVSISAFASVVFRSYRYYKFRSRINNLCNHCRN